MAGMNRYILGQTYETLSGELVTIITRQPEAVEGSDGVWRYDREGRYENGRVTGTPAYPPDLRNFKNGAWLKHSYIVNKIMNDFGSSDSSSLKHDSRKAKRETAVALDTLLDKVDMLDVFEVFNQIEKSRSY